MPALLRLMLPLLFALSLVQAQPDQTANPFTLRIHGTLEAAYQRPEVAMGQWSIALMRQLPRGHSLLLELNHPTWTKQEIKEPSLSPVPGLARQGGLGLRAQYDWTFVPAEARFQPFVGASALLRTDFSRFEPQQSDYFVAQHIRLRTQLNLVPGLRCWLNDRSYLVAELPFALVKFSQESSWKEDPSILPWQQEVATMASEAFPVEAFRLRLGLGVSL